MSLFTEASLVMIPSGVKDGKLYSIKPDDGVGDFTFTRGSNLAATRVDENGLIEKGRENLLLQSNQFDTTWFFVGAPNLTGNQIGYDGTNDAWSLASTGTQFASVRQNISVSQLVTFSTYAKAGSLDFLIMYTDVSFNSVWFNLANGTIGTIESNVIDASIIDVGDGWYRCSITSSSASSCRLYPTNANATFGTTSGNIYIQDAQLELGLVATEYIETGATSEQAGILENLPRLDYSDSSCPSLLLEPTRTNLVTQSEYFASSDWSDFIYSGASINKTFGYASPENKNNAYKWDIVTGTGGVLVTDNITVTASVDYSLSVWMKGEVGGEKVRLDFKDTSSAGVNGPLFTLTTEWVRYEVSVTNSAGTSRGFQFRMLQSEGVGSQTIYVYGAQLEAGSYPTSYIPTYGTSVTRSVDSCSVLNVASLIGQSEGTILFDAKFQDADRVNFSLSDSTANNHITIDTSSSYSVFARIVEGGVTQAQINTTTSYFSNGDTLKCAVAYKENDFAFYINGTQIGVDASGTIPLCDDIKFARYNGSINAYQNVNKVLLFKSRLSNTELIALTTI